MERADDAGLSRFGPGEERSGPLLPLLVPGRGQDPAVSVGDEQRLVGLVVAQDRGQVFVEVALGPRHVARLERQRLHALEHHERGRPARHLVRPLPHPVVDLAGLAEEVVRQRLADLLREDFLVAVQQVAAHHHDRDPDAQEHDQQQLGAKGEAQELQSAILSIERRPIIPQGREDGKPPGGPPSGATRPGSAGARRRGSGHPPRTAAGRSARGEWPPRGRS